MGAQGKWTFLIIAAAAFSITLGAKAQDMGTVPLMPPLSHYGPLSVPVLKTDGLQEPVKPAVEAAIAAAAQGTKRAMEAENILVAAKRAAADRPAGILAISIHGASCRYHGESAHGRADGLGIAICGTEEFIGQFRDEKPSGLGADYKFYDTDAYEGEYRDGERSGFGVERDKDGFYPGRYGVYRGKQKKPIVMELMGTQDFAVSHWAGTYGFYEGPKVACTLIKGAVLEGSVLDGAGAKFDGNGRLTEQGRYRIGILEGGNGPPC